MCESSARDTHDATNGSHAGCKVTLSMRRGPCRDVPMVLACEPLVASLVASYNAFPEGDPLRGT